MELTSVDTVYAQETLTTGEYCIYTWRLYGCTYRDIAALSTYSKDQVYRSMIKIRKKLNFMHDKSSVFAPL